MKDLKRVQKKTIPMFACAIMLSVVMSVLFAVIATLLISTEVLQESAISYCAGAVLFLGTIIGGFRITADAGQSAMLLCLAYSVAVILIWAVVHFVLFSGPFQGFLPQALLLLGGGVTSGLLRMRGKKGRKKRYF